MSTIRVEVTTIDNVRLHGNADNLELADVKGWQMGVPKGKYTNGDKVVYFESGTVIPPELAERLGIVNYLKSKTDINGDKVLVVDRTKLRGEPSFGLVIDLADPEWPVGADVADHYSAVKFFPPVKQSAGDADVDHPMFLAYTDVENMRNFPAIFEEGELVEASLKIHGTNSRIGFVAENIGVPSVLETPDRRPMQYMAGSRTLRRKDPGIANRAHNTYWMPLTLEPVQGLLEALYMNGHKQAILYGEVFGAGVQPGYDYALKTPGFRAFDLMIDGKYVSRERFYELLDAYGVLSCPIPYRGPFSLDAIRSVSEGDPLIGGSRGREGVVVRPMVERDTSQIGRCILKYVGNEFLFNKNNQQDTTDQ